MKKFSVYQAAKRLGISRTTLLKEIEDGHIVAHKRRHRIIFFEDDIKYYEKQNTINAMDITKNVEKNNLMTEHADDAKLAGQSVSRDA